MGAADLQDVSVQLFYDGVWNEVADQTFVAEAINTLWGQGSEGAAPRPSRIALALDNATDKFRVSNPESPLWGRAGRNVPLRVLVDGDVVMTAEVSTMAPDRTIDFQPGTPPRGRAWVDVEAGGLLRRIGQWTHTVRSPHTVYDLAIPGLINYWALEDPAGTASPAAAFPAGQRIAARDIQFAAQAGPDGSDTLPRFNKNGLIGAYFQDGGASDTAGWTYFFSLKLPTGLETGYQATALSWATKDLSQGTVRFLDTDMNIRFTTPNGTLVVNRTVDVSDTDFTEWNHFIVKCSVSGGTVSLETSWYNESSGVLSSVTDTFARTVTSQPYNWVAFGSDSSDGMTFGHVGAAVGRPSEVETTDRFEAIAGFPGETVGDRYVRVLAQEGVTGTLVGDADATMPMGPQHPGRLIDLLQEMVTTEDGLLFDARDSIGLVFRTRADRYASASSPALALTYPGDISHPFTEVVDDLETHNVVTVRDVTGFEHTESLTTGPMSAQDPPDGVGEYRQTVQVNVDDPENVVPVLAEWWLNRGTLSRSRYPTVIVDLVANPGLAASAAAVSIGDVITVDGYEPTPIPLIVIGIAQRIDSHLRRITFTTAPADLFVPAKYDEARYDVENSTTNASQTTTSVSWAIKATDHDSVWSTTSTPYDWLVEGERVTVTAMTAPAGTGPYTQTATVTRSVNGVVKTHATGEPIHIATPGRYAL